MTREKRRRRGAVRPEGQPARKVLNNNVVVTIDAAGNEQVLMGRGLAFGLGPDDALDPSKVEKTYVLEADADVDYIQRLFADAPYELIEAVSEAVAAAEASLGRPLPKRLAIAVIDHVSFLMQRLDEGIRVPAAPMPELAVLYPEEFAAARLMTATLGERLGVALPEEESVFLTMHLLDTARDDADGAAGLLLRRVQGSIAILEEELGVAVDPTTAGYARFVLHVKFLLQRLATATMLDGPDNSFYEFARKAHPRAHRIAARFRQEVEDASGIRLTNEEMLYLTLHVERLAQQIAPTRASQAGQNVQ